MDKRNIKGTRKEIPEEELERLEEASKNGADNAGPAKNGSKAMPAQVPEMMNIHKLSELNAFEIIPIWGDHLFNDGRCVRCGCSPSMPRECAARLRRIDILFSIEKDTLNDSSEDAELDLEDFFLDIRVSKIVPARLLSLEATFTWGMRERQIKRDYRSTVFLK